MDITAFPLPLPEHSLEEEGRNIADVLLSDLLVDLTSIADHIRDDASMALRIAFWAAYWQESQKMTTELDQMFATQWRLHQGGSMVVSGTLLDTARQRGRQAARGRQDHL